MKVIIISISTIFLTLCSGKDKPSGVNFLVKDNRDTLSPFHYQGFENYQFYDSTSVDSTIVDDNYRSKMPGVFILGIRDRTNFQNRYLAYIRISRDDFKNTAENSIPFFHGEYKLRSEYEVHLWENYYDSTTSPIEKYETYVAIDKQTSDTLLYQEVIFFFNPKQISANLIVYDNLESREEMRLAFESAFNTIKRSYE